MASRMVQNNFSGGEISPTLYGRSDLQAYYKGCAKAENFVIAKEGTLRKRHGIESRIEIETPWEKTKIVPYLYDRTTAGFFVLSVEGTTLTAEFYNKDFVLKDTGTCDDFAGSIKSIQAKQIGDQVWISNGEFFRILDVADGETFEFTEWTQAGIPDSIPHNDDDARTLKTHWSIKRDANRTGKTIYYAVIGVKDSVNSERSEGNCAWSASWVAGSYIDIGVTVAVGDTAKWDQFIVAKKQGGTFGELSRIYTDDTPDHYFDANMAEIYKWSDGKYYDRAEDSATASEAAERTLAYRRWIFKDDNISPGEAVYGQTNILGEGFTVPLCVDCFQQRRVFANAATDDGKLPMTLWFSEVGNLDNFYADRPTADDDSFSPTITSTGPAFIRWIVSYNEMLVLLTDSGLFSVGFSTTSGFSASSCRISRFSGLAVSPDIQPVVTDAGVVFVAADNKTLYTAAYDIQENMLKPTNRSVLTEHLTRTSSITALALQSAPDNVIWVVTDNGRYAAFTFERNEEVFAWAEGFVEGAEILDVVSLGSVTDSSTDRTYTDLVFVVRKGDSVWACAPTTGWEDIIGDEPENVKATLVTLRPESQERTIVGMQKNVKDMLLRLYETGGIAVKPTSGGANVPLVDARMPGDLFTGDVKVMPRGVINENGQMTFVSDNAEPCEILQIVTSLEV